MKHHALGWLVAASLCSFGPLVAATSGVPKGDPVDRPAIPSAFAARSVLLGAVAVPGGVIAVGERGHVVTAGVDGSKWTQSAVPVSATLTAVDAVSARHAIAVGHGLTVLRSLDAGRSWQRQANGVELAKAFAQAEAGARQRGELELASKLGRLAAERGDKPLLDVLMIDDRSAFAVGAYGVALRTRDGGSSWESACELFPGGEDRHMYAIRRIGKDIWVAGEGGLMYRSRDHGASFQRVEGPGQSTLFGVAGHDGQVLAVGLRGTVAATVDDGRSWYPIDAGATASFTAVRADVATAGIFWATDDNGGVWRIDVHRRTATATSLRSRAPIAAFLIDAGRRVTAFGLSGAADLGVLPPPPSL